MINNVSALSYDYTLLNENYIGGDLQPTFNISHPNNSNDWKTDTINFTNSIVNPNGNFLRFAYSGIVGTTTGQTFSVNLSESCSHTVNGERWYTITYQNGDTATIKSSLWSDWCDRHNESGTITSNELTISDFDFQIFLVGNTYWQQCEMDNGYILCPIKNNETYSALKFNYYGIKSNSVYIDYKMKIRNGVWSINGNSQAIINNQNQNTTSINNNITNLNDNILNSSINSQTTSDVNNISTNNINNSSKNVILDFMLLPINFLQNLLNSFDSTCATLCLGDCSSGHDNDFYFVFPCIDLQSILGSSVYNVIDVLMTFGMVFAFIRSVVKFLKKALLLESDVSSEVQIF